MDGNYINYLRGLKDACSFIFSNLKEEEVDKFIYDHFQDKFPKDLLRQLLSMPSEEEVLNKGYF